MSKVLKKLFTFFVVLLVIVGAFVAGDYLNLNIPSLVGFFPTSRRTEPLLETEPHVADEVIEVETVVPIDESGAGEVELVTKGFHMSLM